MSKGFRFVYCLNLLNQRARQADMLLCISTFSHLYGSHCFAFVNTNWKVAISATAKANTQRIKTGVRVGVWGNKPSGRQVEEECLKGSEIRNVQSRRYTSREDGSHNYRYAFHPHTAAELKNQWASFIPRIITLAGTCKQFHGIYMQFNVNTAPRWN